MYSPLRRYAAECLGTAGLLCAVIGSGIMGENLAGGNVAIALLANTLATVFALFVLIEVFGPISGAHFNPAVTVMVKAARLAGNVLSTAAMRATLGDVLTDAAFEHMITLATRFTEGVVATLEEYDVPWSISQLGARAEYRFARPAPRTGTESAHAEDDHLDEYLHLFMANRGVLMTPFHNMALMCPTTTAADVDLHTTLFAEAVRRLVA